MLASRCGLPALKDDATWSLLSCVFFWAWALNLGLGQDDVPRAQPTGDAAEPEVSQQGSSGEALAYASGSCAETLVRDTQRYLEANQPPSDTGSLRASGWRDVSKPTAKVFLLYQPDRVVANIDVQTRQQLPSFPILEVNGDEIKGGAIPIFWKIGQWPTWFPFCESATLLTRLAADREVWHVKFRIAILTVDMVLFVALIDRLDTDGCVDIIMRSPPLGSEGQSWLGVQVPEVSGKFRCCCNAYRISLWPTSKYEGRVRVHSEMDGGCPSSFEWIGTLFWQTVSTRVIAMIAKVQSRWSGSKLDVHFGSSDAKDERQVFLGINERLDEFLARTG